MYGKEDKPEVPSGGAIVDMTTGYAINVPAEDQMPPDWYRDPETASRIMALRARHNVELHDALWDYLQGTRAI